MAGQTLYPEIEPYDQGMLEVGDGHSLYWEVSGNPTGHSVAFVHGGPGGGTAPVHRRFFDPAHYRIVLFDQRGAGKSTPLGGLINNTTPHLIADMEALRRHLAIEHWHVFGGSWGSTLAIAYGEAHPARVASLVLRGIFLCRPGEIDWFLYGMKHVFPEAWHDFSGFIPEAERDDLLAAYGRRLNDANPAVHMPAAKSWSRYEGACSTLLPSAETVATFEADVMALGLARIEAHYFTNAIFLPPDSLLANVGSIRLIPTAIVQGRYDIVCPIVTADDLHRVWPEADYVVVPDAGHSAMEPGIQAELVRATDRFRTLDV